MKQVRFMRTAIALSAAAMLLTGCGGDKQEDSPEPVSTTIEPLSKNPKSADALAKLAPGSLAKWYAYEARSGKTKTAITNQSTVDFKSDSELVFEGLPNIKTVKITGLMPGGKDGEFVFTPEKFATTEIAGEPSLTKLEGVLGGILSNNKQVRVTRSSSGELTVWGSDANTYVKYRAIGQE